MSYINKNLLKSHNSIEGEVDTLIRNNLGRPEGDVYQLLAEEPSLSYKLFKNSEKGVDSLVELYSLLKELDRWVRDCGDFTIIRWINEPRSRLKGKCVYQYAFCSGEYAEGVPAKVEDVLQFLKLEKAAKDFIRKHVDGLQNRDLRSQYCSLSRLSGEYLESVYLEGVKLTVM